MDDIWGIICLHFIVSDTPGLDPNSYSPFLLLLFSWFFYFLRLGSLCLTSISTILLALDIMLRLGRGTWHRVEKATDDEMSSKWGVSGSPTEGLPWYPTNFLQDVIPKPIHSHNDYWRKVPLFTALRQGCISVEADVWLFDDPEHREHLYVGHAEASLQQNRTFQSLYIQPLVNILTRQNPTTEFYNANGRGVFDTSPNQTLTLLVDVKTAGPETWAKVVEQLEPLRERGWLTHVAADGTVRSRAITVIGTGNMPIDDILTNTNTVNRDYFLDAPLGKLSGAGGAALDATNSYYASVSFASAVGAPWMGRLNAEQLRRIRWQVGEAHSLGLRARYWDLPQWPVKVRNLVWDTLVEEGVDVLNVDDVKAAAGREWKR